MGSQLPAKALTSPPYDGVCRFARASRSRPGAGSAAVPPNYFPSAYVEHSSILCFDITAIGMLPACPSRRARRAARRPTVLRSAAVRRRARRSTRRDRRRSARHSPSLSSAGEGAAVGTVGTVVATTAVVAVDGGEEPIVLRRPTCVAAMEVATGSWGVDPLALSRSACVASAASRDRLAHSLRSCETRPRAPHCVYCGWASRMQPSMGF